MLVAACAAVPVQKRLLPLLARPASASACPPGATFVSLVSNESYVPGALCLVRAMRKLGGTCPFLLLLADLPAPPGAHVALSAASSSSLAQAYGGRTQLLPLSALQARLVAHTHNASGSGHRRRLRTLHPTGWVQNTHRKLLLWALPGFSKVVFLDIDILIVANVDALLREAPFSAAAALPYATSLFNSGVMVLSPSLATAAALQSLSASTGAGAHGAKSASTSVAPRIRGALESRGTGHLSDQSILNHHFKGRWRQLPYGYNVGHKVHAVNRKLWGQIELASIHFVGRPKPWEVEPGSYRPGRGAPDATLTRRWHESCGREAAARSPTS